MGQVTTGQTKEYLDIVVKLETSAYTMKRIVADIQWKIKSCQSTMELNAPSSGKAIPADLGETEPEKPNEKKAALAVKLMAVSVFCMLIGGIFGLVLLFTETI